MEAGSLQNWFPLMVRIRWWNRLDFSEWRNIVVDNANVSEKVSEGDTVAENADAVADTDTQDEESVTDQEMEEELGTENVDGAETE